jgi:transposase
MTDVVALMPLLFVGIDWGSVTHRVVAIDAAGKQVREWTVEHSGAALTAFAEQLVAMVDGAAARCHVALEVTTGPLVEVLLDRGLTVFAINPKQSDRFRDRYAPSGAKDDRRDALVAASAVRTDAAHLTRLSASDRRTVTLRATLRLREELVLDKSRLLNRLREQLWRYFAQVIELADGDLDMRWLWALIEKAPTPQDAAKLSRPVVARLLRDHRTRKWEPDAVLAILRKPSLVVADGVPEAAATHVRSIVPRLQLLDAQIRDADRSIDQQLELWAKLDGGANAERPANDSSSDEDGPNGDEPPGVRETRDAQVLRSLPGVGPVTLATLLTEVAAPLARRDYRVLRLVLGVAPVTRQSGGSKLVMMRRATTPFLRNAMFNWARSAVRVDAGCRARFSALLARGKRRPHAYRAVVDHLLRSACAMLRGGTEFDAEHAARAHAARA